MAPLVSCMLGLALLAHSVASQEEPTSHAGTTPNIEEVFEGRCWDYDVTKYNNLLPRVDAACDELWAKFFGAFSYQPPCAVRTQNYQSFLSAATQVVPRDKALFWSGVYTLAHRYAETGPRYITLEDTLIGYLANSLTWCGQSTDPGMNLTRCPEWNDCPSEASESFWAGASVTFASQVKGQVLLMIDGSNPSKAAYRQNSFFAKYELPSLNVSEVTQVNIIVTHALDMPRLETCSNGSVVTLKQDIAAQGLSYTCLDNPSAVLHLLCADDPTSRECQLGQAHMTGQLTYNPNSTPTTFNQMPPDMFV